VCNSLMCGNSTFRCSIVSLSIGTLSICVAHHLTSNHCILEYITMNLCEILILNSFLTVDCKSGGKLNTTGDQEGSGNDEEGYQKSSFCHKDGGGGSENKFQL
jgi:hypothetical protein